MSEENGHAARFRFGDAPGNEIDLVTAELVMRKLFTRHPQSVGEALAEVITEQLTGVQIKASKPKQPRP